MAGGVDRPWLYGVGIVVDLMNDSGAAAGRAVGRWWLRDVGVVGDLVDDSEAAAAAVDEARFM